MKLATKERTSMVLSMAKDRFVGMMAPVTLASLNTMTSADMASTSGATGGTTTVNGKPTRCTAMVSLDGTMEEYTRVSLSTIVKKVLEHSRGRTIASMKARGLTESKTVMDGLPATLVSDNRVTGLMERSSGGSMMKVNVSIHISLRLKKVQQRVQLSKINSRKIKKAMPCSLDEILL